MCSAAPGGIVAGRCRGCSRSLRSRTSCRRRGSIPAADPAQTLGRAQQRFIAPQYCQGILPFADIDEHGLYRGGAVIEGNRRRDNFDVDCAAIASEEFLARQRQCSRHGSELLQTGPHLGARIGVTMPISGVPTKSSAEEPPRMPHCRWIKEQELPVAMNRDADRRRIDQRPVALLGGTQIPFGILMERDVG